MNKKVLFFVPVLVISTTLFAQSGNVGIGTTAPTNKLHVNAASDPLRLQGVRPSTSSNDKALVIDANGVVKTGITSQSSFAGYRSTDLAINAAEVNKLVVQTELADKGNEYNTATGLFTPLVTGVYEFEMQVTIRVPGAPTTYGSSNSIPNNERGVMGFADAATNKWVGRFNFQNSRDERSYHAKGVANLTAGQSYYFGVGTSDLPGTLVANPTGLSGNGIGTYFSVTRLQ